MRRVNADFKGLQPVAVPQAFEGKAVAGRRLETIKIREGWRHAAGLAQPGKQHAGFFKQRVTALADALAQGGSVWLGGCFQALAAGCEFPAVKGATQAAALFGAFTAAK